MHGELEGVTKHLCAWFGPDDVVGNTPVILWHAVADRPARSGLHLLGRLVVLEAQHGVVHDKAKAGVVQHAVDGAAWDAVEVGVEAAVLKQNHEPCQVCSLDGLGLFPDVLVLRKLCFPKALYFSVVPHLDGPCRVDPLPCSDGVCVVQEEEEEEKEWERRSEREEEEEEKEKKKEEGEKEWERRGRMRRK